MYSSYICNKCDFKGFACVCVCADGSGAPKATTLPCAERCGVDAALLWHPADFVLPPLYPALQKQQVVCKGKYIHHIQ